jgi:hypothetical protein
MLLAYTTIACAALANGQSPAEAAQGLMANTPWPNDGLAVVEAAQVDLCTGGGQ